MSHYHTEQETAGCGDGASGASEDESASLEASLDSRAEGEKRRDRQNPLVGGPLVVETREQWAERFGRSAPIEVEVGFGYGHFLLEYAASRPEVGIVGLEVRRSFVARVARRAERLGRSNIAVLRGDARRLLPALFAPASVRAFHIQFPDPWWKKKHLRRRLVDESFVTLLHRLLEPSGRVYLRTDVLAYGEVMIDAFEDGTRRFANLESPRAFARDDGLGIPSNRERRYLASSTPVYRLVYEKR